MLARAIPYDKHLLVVGLRDLGLTVAVTGDGINDVDALRSADVGLSMGSGCSVAKDASDMILMDNNFDSTMKAVMWGRNIYANVKRFIQFQVTVNFSALACVFISAILKGYPCFSIIQLLWINLIMDTLAALSLATERPRPSIISAPPIRKNEKIMTTVMWRSIYGMSIYITLVMTLLIIFGKLMWDLDYERSTDFYNEDGSASPRLKHYTLLFNTFIFMHVFN